MDVIQYFFSIFMLTSYLTIFIISMIEVFRST